MIRSLYTATSGMMVEERKMYLASKNLFHAQTPGYKSFSVLRASRGSTRPTLPTDVQAMSKGDYVEPGAGSLRHTGKPLDLALEGEGFFLLDTPWGTAVTRDGRFHLADDKVVRDFSGNALLGQEGPVQLPEESTWDSVVQVEEDGTLLVDGEVIDRIRMEDYPGFRGLRPGSGSLFYPTGTVPPQPSAARVVQHALETANTSVVGAMNSIIQITRAFEAYQKTIQTVMDDITGQAVRRIGRVA